jgi:hypothetical protein
VQVIQPLVVLSLALPDHKDSPTGRFEHGGDRPIALHVAIEFQLPELCIRRRLGGESAIAMTMPKASVHENDYSMLRQYDVGSTRQGTIVDSKAKPCSVQIAPDSELRRSVGWANRGHHPGSRPAIYDVDHWLVSESFRTNTALHMPTPLVTGQNHLSPDSSDRTAPCKQAANVRRTVIGPGTTSCLSRSIA